MTPNFPKNESVLSWGPFSLSLEEKAWQHLVDCFDDIVIVALFGAEDRVTMSYKNELFSDFLKSMGRRDDFEKYLRGNDCNGRYVFDSFSSIAIFARPAFLYLFDNPSSELVKEDALLPVEKARSFGPATSKWLSTRPGDTIKEKISPKNKIRTTITKFSINTKENQQMRYLYESLFWIMGSKVMNAKCQNCHKKDCLIKKQYDDLDSLFRRRGKLNNSLFSEIEKKKQPFPNNKLISDANYKTIWDSSKHLAETDLSLKEKWESLDTRIISIFMYGFVSSFLSHSNVKVTDFYGKYEDSFAYIGFQDYENSEDQETGIKLRIDGDNAIETVTFVQKKLSIIITVSTFNRVGVVFKEAFKPEVITIDFQKEIEDITLSLVDKCTLYDFLLSDKARSIYEKSMVPLIQYMGGEENEK